MNRINKFTISPKALTVLENVKGEIFSTMKEIANTVQLDSSVMELESRAINPQFSRSTENMSKKELLSIPIHFPKLPIDNRTVKVKPECTRKNLQLRIVNRMELQRVMDKNVQAAFDYIEVLECKMNDMNVRIDIEERFENNDFIILDSAFYDYCTYTDHVEKFNEHLTSINSNNYEVMKSAANEDLI